MKFRNATLICIFSVILIVFSSNVYANDEIDISSEYYGPLWDCNHDGTADWLDVSLVSAMYDESGSPAKTWSRADITEDGTVNWLDVSALSAHYDETWTV